MLNIYDYTHIVLGLCERFMGGIVMKTSWECDTMGHIEESL